MVTVRGLKKKGLFGRASASIAYERGMTISQVLEGAGIATPLPTGSTVTVNGNPVTLENPATDNSIVVVTPSVENG